MVDESPVIIYLVAGHSVCLRRLVSQHDSYVMMRTACMSCPRSVQDEENEETGKFRGIVFVRERKIATRLCQLIREHPELSKVGISPAVRFLSSVFFTSSTSSDVRGQHMGSGF
jgi:hypothetical protein